MLFYLQVKSTRILTADTALYKNYHFKICGSIFACNLLDNFVIYNDLISAYRGILQQTGFTIVSRDLRDVTLEQNWRDYNNQIESYVIVRTRLKS